MASEAVSVAVALVAGTSLMILAAVLSMNYKQLYIR